MESNQGEPRTEIAVMTALEKVYAVIVFLYFVESLLFIRAGQVVLRESFRENWSIVVNGFELSGINRRVVVGPLLPASGAAVVDVKELETFLSLPESTQSQTEAADFESRFTVFRQLLEPIEVLSNTLAAFLFVGFPLEVRVLGLDVAWTIILGQLITLMVLTGLFVSLSSRRLLGRPLPLGDIAAMAVSPFAAIRAPRSIWREFVAENSPAILRRLLPPQAQ